MVAGSRGHDRMFPIIHRGGWLKVENRKWGGPIWRSRLILGPRFLEKGCLSVEVEVVIADSDGSGDRVTR